jgi:hypothetical protein
LLTVFGASRGCSSITMSPLSVAIVISYTALSSISWAGGLAMGAYPTADA